MNMFFKLKKKNDGSTMLFVLVGILFIGLLATLISALTAASFKMKNVDYLSRKNFYEGEEYTSKIYNEFGMTAVGILGESYVTTMGKLSSSDIYSKDTMNKFMMDSYYKNMLINLKLVDKDIPNDDLLLPLSFANVLPAVSDESTGLVGRIQNVIDPAKTQVTATIGKLTSVGGVDVVTGGDVYAIPEGVTKDEVIAALGSAPNCLEYDTITLKTVYPVIIINDVHLKYINDGSTSNQQKNYQTDFTFDLVIRYPDWEFTYASPKTASSDVDTFLDYVLIANNAIKFNGVNETVIGCVSAGSNGVVAMNEEYKNDVSALNYGIQINNGADVRFSPNSSNRYAPLAIVASDNVTINSTITAPSYMQIIGNGEGKLWCNSVILNMASTDYDGPVATGSSFVTNSANLYIQDDLQLDGDYSYAAVNGGSYFGYSSNSSTTSNTAQNSSSAIMVNGNKSSINLNGLDRLNVNGLAYLNFKNKGTLYRTGESITVKGTQQMYLVPDDYMVATTGAKISNPVKIGGAGLTYTPDATAIANNLAGFFGSGFLNPVQPFIVRNYTINGSEYAFLYLNFTSTSAQGNYVKNILNSTSTDAVLLSIRDKVLKDLAEMEETPASLLSVSATSAFTAGAIVTATGGEEKGTAKAEGVADVVVDSMNFRNRYLLMKSLLMPVPESEIVSDFGNVVCADLVYKNAIDSSNYPSISRAIVNQYLNRSAVDNTIDTSKLIQYAGATGVWTNAGHDSASEGNLVYINTRGMGEANVTSYANSGVVVVYGDAVVRGSFNGLIIATGKITVSNSGTLTSNPDLVEKILKAEQSCADPRSDVFRFFPCDISLSQYGKPIDTLDYKDVVFYNNWRRY